MLTSSVAPTGFMIRSNEGYRLAGRWAFSSGVDHASWIMLGANLRAGGAAAPAEYFLCFVRASEAMVIDDWHVSGLRATGSKSVELRDVFVPEHRALLLRGVRERTAPGLAVHGNAFYRLPWEAVFISAFPPAALGASIAMLEGFRDYTAARINRFSGQGFRTNAGSAMRLAESAAEVDSARAIFRRDLADLDRLAANGGAPAPGAMERILYDAAFIVDMCSRAVLRLFRGSGGRAIHETHPLQRHFRDLHAMTQHASMDTDGTSEAYGRALLQNATLALGVRDDPTPGRA
jgi:alkylation response protein AidB-like acyl-CoA dehydrogenase